MRRALVVLLLISYPAPGSAWTDAAVRSVHAEVQLAEDASIHVTLTATVRVHGGWLEGIEIAGLDENLVLDDEYEVWAEDGEGRIYHPQVRLVRGNRVQISFPGRSPRRGELRIGFAYRASLAHRATEPLASEDAVRVRWTLPGWRSGLDGVQLDVVAPAGTQLGPRDPGDDGVDVSMEVEELADRTVLHWRRAHLPRTVPWTVSFDVPAGVLDESLRGAPVVLLPPPPTSAALAPPADPTWFWIALAAVLGILGLAQIVLVSRLASRAASEARPLLFAPAIVRAVVILVAAPVGAWLGAASEPLCALATLALVPLAAAYRPGAAPSPPKLGAWREVGSRWLDASRSGWRVQAGPSALLDATTALGAVHCLAWLALPWAWAQPPVPFHVMLVASVLPLPIFLTGTRVSFPRSAPDVLRQLLRVASSMRELPYGVALRPVMHVSADGDVQDARVRTALEHRPEGLLRLDLALGHLPHTGGWHTQPMWLVLTRAGSPAEEALQRALPMEPAVSRGGRRVVRCVDASDGAFLKSVIEALKSCPAAEPTPRGHPVPLETVRDLPPPQAVGF